MATLQQTPRTVIEEDMMHMPDRPTARVLVLLSGAVAAATSAQQDVTPPAQQVEVIGVSPVPGVNVPKDRIPANAQTARAADIERSQALDLTDFMNRRLGSVSPSTRCRTTRSSPTSTSAASRHRRCWERRKACRSTSTACA